VNNTKFGFANFDVGAGLVPAKYKKLKNIFDTAKNICYHI